MDKAKANRVGYLVLRGFDVDVPVFARADKIAFLDPEKDGGTYVTSIRNVTMKVAETAEEILEQLENIHPNML